MNEVKNIKLFVSCPGDISEELDSIRVIVNEINKTSGTRDSFRLELLNWKEDTYTQIGSDAQEVINNQLEPQYDILVGLMWQKLGTPTKRDKSGTVEEINRCLENESKEQLIYFNVSPPEDLNAINLEQLIKVKEFKSDLSSLGVLYKEYHSINQFDSLFRINLNNLILDQILNNEKLEEVVVEVQPYSEIHDLIKDVEENEYHAMDPETLELIEDTTHRLNLVTSSLKNVASSMNWLTERLNSRTTQLNNATAIKDNRLRESKSKKICNDLALELNEFNEMINNEVPEFSSNFIKVSGSYSDILIAASQYDNDTYEETKSTAMELRDAVESSTKGSANLLKFVRSWPPAFTKLNKSKRETELTVKNLTKEMLNGLMLLDEALL
ncbi:MAG: hypothetical protein MK105_19715 [Crocinitomicaceae bacterium]|nr:hypothetical protein [Crocinitomicaceae bacterium]